MQKVLVFAPHPDDDVIGCGGSILKHVGRGNVVGVVYLTSGDNGGLGYSPDELMTIREVEAGKAAQFLGVSRTFFLRNPDGNLGYTRDNIVRLTTLLREFRPDVAYIPHRYDEHRDHRAAYELAVESCLWAGSPRAQECGCEPWRVGTVLCYEVGTALREVNYVEDISAMIKTKLAAMAMHESQLVCLQYTEAVEHLNRLRGINTGQGMYCECFEVLRVAALF
ncbi:MAG: PIG-L family deacetylase [Negativicutes bacterium]|nr:PIG-L family deacetylase [Negativicutes bacterium]